MTDQNQTQEQDRDQEMKNREEAKKRLEENRLAIMEELSKQPEGDEAQYPPEIVERINQILNDAAASLPPGPSVAAQPETNPDAVMERARKQIKDALAQYPHIAPETIGRIESVVGSAAPATPEDGKPAPVKPVF